VSEFAVHSPVRQIRGSATERAQDPVSRRFDVAGPSSRIIVDD